MSRATAPPVLQIAPDTEVLVGDGQTGTLLATPAPTMAKLAWGRPPPPAVPLSALGMCHPGQVFKPVWEELRGCGPTLHWHQLQQPTIGFQHSLPDPKPNLEAAQKKGLARGCPCSFS